MFTIQRLSQKIDALRSPGSSLDDFADWFRQESWGFYDVSGDELSSAIAAVHHILYSYDNDELLESGVARALAKAVSHCIGQS